MDPHVPPTLGITSRNEPMELESVASFVDHVNKTVGKHFRCCICLSILENPVMLPCNHSLCRGCSMQAMRQYRRCPQCLTDIPNLRSLQGRNKWITSMVDSLRNCLNEVGVSLTQHAPVPAKYQNARPPPPRQRSKARSRGQSSAGRRPRSSSPSPSVSCGGGVHGGSNEVGSASVARKPGRGSGAKRKRLSPARSSGSGEEAARSPASRPPRQTPLEIVVRSQPDVRHSHPGASTTGQAGGMAVQQIARDADQASALSTSSGVSLSPAPAPPSPPPRRFAVGDLVMVDNRTWPGMNKYGGVAFVCAVLDPPGSFYDVKYSLTRKIERGVEARFVHPYAFMDDGVRNRSRRNTDNRNTKRSRSRVAKANGAASGSTPEKEGTAADDHIATTSASAGGATLTASPLRTLSPCRDAGECGLSPAAGPTSLQVQPNRDALEEKNVFKGEHMNETTGGRVTEKGSGSATSMAVISRIGRDNSDDARLERRHDTDEEEKDGEKVKAPDCEERRNSGAAQSDDSVVTLPGASGERVNGTSKSWPGRRCDTVGEAKDHRRQEAPLQTNGSASVERGNDSDTTLTIASGGEEGESSDDDELQPCDSEANGDHSPPEGTVGNADREVNEELRLLRGSDACSPVERHQNEHNRVLEADLRNSRHAGGEQDRGVTSADSRQLSQQNRTFGAIVPDNGQTEKSRRAGPPQLVREYPSDNATPGPDKDVGTTQDVGPLSPTTRPAMNDPRPSAVGLESPFSPRSAGPSTRKVDDNTTRESRADRDAHVERDQWTGAVTLYSLENVLRSRPPAEKGKGKEDPPLRGATCQSFASTAHGAPHRSAEQSLQVMTQPPSLASPSPKRPSYRVGDLVDVLSRSSPGVNKEGGVARVTRANTDGTYNVKYCVRQGTEKAVDAAIMSPYALSGECDSGGDHGNDDGSVGKGERKGRAVMPSPSAVNVSVRRTHRRGSCPPDAAAGQANAACLNFILGDTQHPELALDPDLIHDLGSETPRLESGETVGETKSGSACVLDSIGATLCGEEEDGDKGGKVPRRDAKRKTENDKRTVASKQGVGSKKTRAGGTGRRPSSRKGASAVVSSGERTRNTVETTPSETRRGRGSPVVLTLSSLTPEMIDVAESLAVSHGWRAVPKYMDDVTHIVCGTAPRTNKASIRSAKFLQAVASGKWVVNEAWLQECQLRGEHVEEEAFEIAGDRKSTVPSAPRRSRLAHADPDRQGLFHGTTFLLRGNFGKDSPPLSELEAMLLANGATVVKTINALFARQDGCSSGSSRRDSRGTGFSGSWRPPRVVIFQPSANSPEGDAKILARDLAPHAMVASSPGSEKVGRGDRDRIGGARREGDAVEVLKPLWLVDSVGSFRVLHPTVVHRVHLPDLPLSS